MIDYGLELAGFETAWQVEIDPYCLAILGKNRPGVQKFADIRKCGVDNGEYTLGAVDLISGGFPCTDISIGGHGSGIGTRESPTSRSGLWYEFHRVVREMQPRWVIVENVSRLCHTTDGSQVISDLEGEGYACWPLVLETEVFGAPHPRPRTWILCCNDHSHGNCDIGEGVEFGKLPDDIERAFAENCKHWDHWKRELGAGDDGKDGLAGQSQSAAYGGGLRAIHGDTHWVDRVRCCGNSVVWLVPALLGSFIAESERVREARAAQGGFDPSAA